MIYPEDALREAVTNAVIHRDYLGAHTQLRVYDHKLWLWNAGTLPDEITFEKLKKAHVSCPRNELLADVFFKAGYIEAWGRGTVKIIEACRKANLPDPEFSELTGGFLVSFTRGEGTVREKWLVNKMEETREKTREETREKIIRLIGEEPTISMEELRNAVGITIKGVEWQISRLKKQKILKRVGPDKGGHWEIVKGKEESDE